MHFLFIIYSCGTVLLSSIFASLLHVLNILPYIFSLYGHHKVNRVDALLG